MFTGPSLNSKTRSETCPEHDLPLTEIACIENPTFREKAPLYYPSVQILRRPNVARCRARTTCAETGLFSTR